MYRMNVTHYCGCTGWQYRYQRMGKMLGMGLESDLEWIETFIHGKLLGIPNDCLRFDHNQTLFFLLTLSRDPLWCYKVKKLHPKTRPFHIIDGCFLCELELIGLDLHGLVDRLIDIGPYDEPPTLDTEDDTLPPRTEEDTEDEESVGENGPMNDPKEDSIEEKDLKKDLDEEPKKEPLEVEKPEEEPLENEDSEEEALIEEDLEEDPVGEPLEPKVTH